MPRRLASLGQGPDISQLVSDLLGLQDQVQQYAPSLASQWGWLAQQGALIRSGQAASITSDVWVSQYRSFWSALQQALPSQDQSISDNFKNILSTDAQAGFPQGIQADVDTYGSAATSAGNAIANSSFNLGQYIPLIVGAIVFAIVAPTILRALEDA